MNSPVVANIRSFAVSPDNLSLYVLKPGRLILYTNCSDRTVDIAPAVGPVLSFRGVPDCELEDFESWEIGANIESIAVDFGHLLDPALNMAAVDEEGPYTSDDRIFGLMNSGSASLGEIREFNRSTGLWQTQTVGTGFALPENRPRIRTIFISQTFPKVTRPNLFFVDNTCYTADLAVDRHGEWVHCASIYNSADSGQSQDVRELPSQVEGISY
jgi:hypothetical protein